MALARQASFCYLRGVNLQQTFYFLSGLVSDVDDAKQEASSYRDALNMALTERGGLVSIRNIPASEVKAELAETDHRFVYSFQCVATFGPTKTERDSLFLVSSDQNGFCNLYVFDMESESLHKIYDDNLRPIRDRSEPLRIATEVDAFHKKIADSWYVFWVDGVNPIRNIRVHVEDPSEYDNSASPLSPLYIANEPDLLLLQRLFPVDEPVVDRVEGGGTIPVGAYAFSFRYYNTETCKYSTWSNFTPFVPVVAPTLESLSMTTNGVYGGAPGANSGKSVVVKVDKSHFHHKYYDSVQLAIVKATGLDTPSLVTILEPNEAMYGSVDSVSYIRYTGGERGASSSIDAINIDESPILTGKTIEHNEGTIYLANVKYLPEEIEETPFSAETHIEELFCLSDPMAAAPTSLENGYYTPINCAYKRGYFRGEVYRFGRHYVDKFGRHGRVKPFVFPLGSYDQSFHDTTWMYNWATSGNDFRFVSRECYEGRLLDDGDKMRAIGLSLSGIKNHPSWAYGMYIDRAPRIKDVLGQSVVVNGIAVTGGYYSLIQEDSAWRAVSTSGSYTELPWENPSGYDYDSSGDHIAPRVIAHGHSKSLVPDIITATATGFRGVWPYLRWERRNTKSFSGYVDGSRHEINALFMYPLEWMTSVGGVPFDQGFVAKAKYVKVVDLVVLSCYSSVRDVSSYQGYSSGPVLGNRYTQGRLSKYAFVYSPVRWDDYYYANGHSPGMLLFPSAPTPMQPTVPVAPYDRVGISSIAELLHGRHGFTQIQTRDGRLSHISKVDSLSELIELQSNFQQITDSYGPPHAQSYPAPGPITPQRGLLVSTNESSELSELLQIADPAYYLASVYSGLLASWSDIFPNAPAISGRLLTESPNASFPLTPTVGLTPARFSFSWPSEGIVQPGSGVPFFVANILSGVGDDRYGQMGADAFIHTGTYTKISGSDISNNEEKDLVVFGGDCYITRAIVKIRDNAPRLADLKVSESFKDDNKDAADFQNQFFGGVGSKRYFDQIPRAAAYTMFSETIDVWVESAVNGHYINRDPGSYPSEIQSRVADPGEGVDHYLPESNTVRAYTLPSLYQYDPSFSREMVEKYFPGESISKKRVTSVQNAIHRSEQAFPGNPGTGDRFLPQDLVVTPDGSGITKLSLVGDDRMVIVHEDNVGQVYLGTKVAEDEAGNTLYLSSGSQFGNIRYAGTPGEFGALSCLDAVRFDNQVYVFDRKRSRLILYNERAKDISSERVEAAIRTVSATRAPGRILVSPGDWRLFLLSEGVDVQIGESEAVGVRGLSYKIDLGAWESRLITDHATIIGFGHAINREYGVSVYGDASRIYKLNVGPSTATYMGRPIESMVEVSVNGGGSSVFKEKVFGPVTVNPSSGSSLPVSARYFSSGGPADMISQARVFTFHNGKYVGITHNFRDTSIQGKRIQGTVGRLTINCTVAQDVSMSYLSAQFYLKHESAPGNQGGQFRMKGGQQRGSEEGD